MNEGAFALVDCLGFKGIWKKTDPLLLIQKLSQIEQTVSAKINADRPGYKYLSFGPIRATVRLLSDTVAISLQYEQQEGKTPDKPEQNYLVMLICDAVIQVVHLFLEGDPPLVLRGCLSYGEHISEGNFIVGPAVDETAEYMNIAEGAFVWLLPSAEERYLRFVARSTALMSLSRSDLMVEAWKRMKQRGYPIDWALDAAESEGPEVVVEAFKKIATPLLNMPLVIEYEMPLKTGARLRCGVLNPLVIHKTEEKRQQTIETYANVISGDRLDIWLKQQHTIDFLQKAHAATTLFFRELPPALANTSEQPRSE